MNHHKLVLKPRGNQNRKVVDEKEDYKVTYRMTIPWGNCKGRKVDTTRRSIIVPQAAVQVSYNISAESLIFWLETGSFSHNLSLSCYLDI